MRVYYTDIFELPLPVEHRFPMAKYRLLRKAVCELGIVEESQLLVPDPASDAELLRVHTVDYVTAVTGGTLDPQAVRRIGFPWSAELVERSRRSVGATLAASRAALSDGVAVNLAGGTHHAYSDAGAGYCVFNDAAVAARATQAENGVERVLIVDCDVHQGDGSAAIFADDSTVFTLSIHGARNYPFRKMASDLDVALPDGTGDDEYVAALETALETALSWARPDLAIYVSGADPHRQDRLGRLRLTREGLRRRDRHVLNRLVTAGIPCAVTMAGGYGGVDDIVSIHAGTVAIASELWRTRDAVALR
ncbi:MAG: histone deacetylase [Acidobacteria bacterium]|nr:histone deacetylase [Acidobacteriota bacterium]